MTYTPRVLSVGQCSADDYRIAKFLQAELGALLDRAYFGYMALQMMGKEPYDLVLVNRILDSDGSSGIAFIKKVRQLPQWESVPLMLVSDYPEAQAAAGEAGALPGFGKSDLGEVEVTQLLRERLYANHPGS